MHTKTLISKLKTVQQETILDTEHDFTEVSAYMENILR
jgi:ABC-type Mn2+/Zn2+ transport system ATPase subunit